MPIYAYKCESCGFAKDVLQKLSDAPLSDCPACAKPTFQKQVTAAGFQLKGSGWYVTDFKGNGSAPSTAVAPAAAGAEGSASPAAPAATSPTSPTSSSESAAAPAPATKPTPSAG